MVPVDVHLVHSHVGTLVGRHQLDVMRVVIERHRDQNREYNPAVIVVVGSEIPQGKNVIF